MRRILVVVNEVKGGWSAKNPETWGGGEETVVGFANALAIRGQDVTVVYDGPDYAPQGGAKFVSRGEFKPGGFDIAVYFKCPEFGGMHLAPRQFLWTDQERPFDPDFFERIFACSDYLLRYLGGVMPRAIERMSVLPYGLDLAELDFAAYHEVSPEGTAVPVDRDPKLVVHASSPDRGLEQLLEMWTAVEAADPEARLEIAYGWDLFDKYGGSPALKERIKAKLATLQRATMKRYTRKDLHELYWRAGVFAYWCTGGEQYGLSVLKAQYCGAVPVVRPWGSLHETVFSGVQVNDPQLFTDALLNALDPEKQEADRRAIDRDLVPSWADIANRWIDAFELTDPPARLISAMRIVPGPPPFAAGADFALSQACEQPIQLWLQTIKPQKVWVDPTIGFAPGNAATAAEADAAIVGYALETHPDWKGYLESLGLKSGTPVFCFFSNTGYRGNARFRCVEPKDARDMLGGCPDFQLQPLPLRPDGEGVFVVTFRYIAGRLGDRDVARSLRIKKPRQTVSVCYMVRNVAQTIGISLQSIEKVADEVCIADTGSTDGTKELLIAWSQRTGIPVTIADAPSPRFSFDSGRELDVGEMGYGQRVAGFESARNVSVALAQGDWVLWLDADEELLNVQNLEKYLTANVFKGYSIQQHHFSCDPPEATKVDVPVRMFRRVEDPEQPKGWFEHGPHKWPTYGTGCTVRFSGLVHEHPGLAPDFTEGLGPAIILSDVHIAHSGYHVEDQRRRRFVRNWPLMALDRQKYPERRLGMFLWLRDLTHQLRWYIESAQGRITPEAQQLAEESVRIYLDEFATKNDPFSNDAFQYVSAAFQVLGRGFECKVVVAARKPEVTGDEAVQFEVAGRFDDTDQLVKAFEARLGDIKERWTGKYV